MGAPMKQQLRQAWQEVERKIRQILAEGVVPKSLQQAMRQRFHFAAWLACSPLSAASCVASALCQPHL